MVNQAYVKYMRSAEWKRKREQAFNYYGRRCYVCKTARGPLQIHHLTYARFGGRELMRDLRPLCKPCHDAVSRLHWKMGKRKFSGEVVFAVFIKMTSAQRSQLLRK